MNVGQKQKFTAGQFWASGLQSAGPTTNQHPDLSKKEDRKDYGDG